MDIFTKNPEMKTHLITNHGLLPLITMLEYDNISVVNAILRLITQVSSHGILLILLAVELSHISCLCYSILI